MAAVSLAAMPTKSWDSDGYWGVDAHSCNGYLGWPVHFSVAATRMNRSVRSAVAWAGQDVEMCQGDYQYFLPPIDYTFGGSNFKNSK